METGESFDFEAFKPSTCGNDFTVISISLEHYIGSFIICLCHIFTRLQYRYDAIRSDKHAASS